MLQQRHDLQIIGEASDGSEAVQKAEELRPDLILLDIGLPKLNGMEAARRLRQLVPGAKILFLSQESSQDVVREAVSLGAAGYIHKLHARSELLPAIEAVLGGKQFVSSGLEGWESTESTRAVQTGPDAAIAHNLAQIVLHWSQKASHRAFSSLSTGTTGWVKQRWRARFSGGHK
jgi:DNA-binding NarL/FixJ family response regulator